MKKTRVTKLLAVMAMTTGTAVADPRPVVPPPPPAQPVAVVAAAESALFAVRVLQMISIELAKPRTRGNGAPACGNVASRAPQPANCQPREKP